MQITKADMEHLDSLITWATWVLSEYPELFTEEEEDELAICRQLVGEKLS